MSNATQHENKTCTWAASADISSSFENCETQTVVPTSTATLMVSFDGEARTISETHHLTVQTNEPMSKVQSQIVVTPSPANIHNNNSTPFSHLYDSSPDSTTSALLSPTISHLQRTVETQLHISTTSASSSTSTGKFTANSSLSPPGPTSTFGGTIPEAPHSTQPVLRDSNIPRTLYHVLDDTSPPSLNQLVRRRKLDTISSNKSPRHHPIYTTDRYIIPNRVQRHAQPSLYASATIRNGYSAKLRSSSPSSITVNNIQPTLEVITTDRILENQENVNPNLPL
jgi:hypothetical protein